MKKVENILIITFILLLFYLTKDINILPLTISFSIYILFNSIFKTTSIKKVVEELHNKKYYYSRDKILLYTLISISLTGVLLTSISYLIGNLLNIDKLNIINIFMSISVLSNVMIKIITEYLEVLGYKKISNNLLKIYNIIVLSIEIILSILLFKVFKLDNNINHILLYSVNVIVFIIIMILLYIIIFKNRKSITKKEEENKINYLFKIKEILISNQIETIYYIINSTYIYISIIILYFVLINKYNYNNVIVETLISNTYFYGLIIIYIIYKIINKYLNIDYSNIKNTFNNNINKIIKTTLNISILLIILSIPINNLLIGNKYNVLSSLSILLFFFIIYNYIVNISIKYNKNKTTLIIILIGLIIKIIFELPFINSFYRMGYNLILGSIFSTILGLVISIILGIIIIKHKFKINLLENFNNILNIIYESIIYTLVIVLLTLIVKIDKVGIINNLLIIFFYIFITILFHIIKRILTKK